ncbi:MAG: preprotein translocase subunit SecG [Candidatus Delongbacteria bacterium]|jgi:preprotein translocase subunit SecG|nr:preprotein translocase subunit SecG [Candidatus Delongbacteria bacterium]
MYVFLTVLLMIVCILCILIVLVQNPKGGGLSSAFGQGNQVMGVRKTTDFLEKATWGLAIAILVLSLFASFAIPRKTMENQDKQQSVQPTEQTAPETPTNDEPPASVPGQ